MRLNNHIAMRFLTDDNLAFEIVEATYPDSYKKLLKDKDSTDEDLSKLSQLYSLVSKEKQKSYLVTETVHDKLDLLKVKVNSEGQYDWTVFNELSDSKKTFILYPAFGWDGGGCLRVLVDKEMIEFCHIRFKFNEGSKDDGTCHWTMFYINRFNNFHADHCNHNDVKQIYEFVYKLLCFVFLSDNEYQEVGAGLSVGTKKNGKFKNDLPIPVTIINSKWNVTVVRTEGFLVSGHFALRRCGIGRVSTRMVYIQPFQKTGYIRRAASESIS